MEMSVETRHGIVLDEMQFLIDFVIRTNDQQLRLILEICNSLN